jgi:hypothetical protein
MSLTLDIASAVCTYQAMQCRRKAISNTRNAPQLQDVDTGWLCQHEEGSVIPGTALAT